jgi:hypothetical protein
MVIDRTVLGDPFMAGDIKAAPRPVNPLGLMLLTPAWHSRQLIRRLLRATGY